MNASPRLLYCRCAYAQVVPLEVKDRVLEGLGGAGAAFEAVPDLCEMSARGDPRLKEIAASAGEAGSSLKIAACYPRAVRWLFAAAEAPLPAGAEVLNMRVESPEDVLRSLLPEGSSGGEGSKGGERR